MVQSKFFVFTAVAVFSFMAVNDTLAQSKLVKGKTRVPSVKYDCTDINISHKNDPTLTREENLALMDRALLRALNKFDFCQDSQASNSGGGSAGGGGGSGSGGGGSGAGNASGGAGGSVASSDMSGTENPKSDENLEVQASGTNASGGASSGGLKYPKVKGRTASHQAALKNGKIPEDIPAADNDSVLEAQIRRAAIKEPDPVLKKKLWNEYRKYKGLPIEK
jgi:hypothetical protein